METIKMERELKKHVIKKEVISWLKTLIVVVVLLVFTQLFLFSNYLVQGRSMMPTIENGERVIVNRLIYKYSSPMRFDMIVFHANDTTDYIKRIIGLPGDELFFYEGKLYVNGEEVEEPFLEDIDSLFSPFTSDFTLEQVTGEQVVPEGYVFVLGDNRRNSIDSRQIGFIPTESIVGKVNFCYWPIKKIRVMR